MIAHNTPNIQEAVSTIRQLTQEEKIRQQCEAREDYYRRTAGREELFRQTTQERDQVVAKLDQILAEHDQAIAERNQILVEHDQVLAEREHLRQLLAKRGIDADEQID